MVSYWSFQLRDNDRLPPQTSWDGVYIFVLEGAVLAAGNQLLGRDGLGLWDVDMVTIECSNLTHVLVMEVPLV